MRSDATKIGIRIWNVLMEKFTDRMDSACLRRDVWLTKVLERELGELEEAGTILGLSFAGDTPPRERVNSQAAQRFIASRLDALPRKLVTFTLPKAQVRRLDALCARKRIVRDSFFNRLLFLLVAHDEHITHLFFEGDESWRRGLVEHADFRSEAAGHFAQRIPEFRNPLHAIRAVFSNPDWQDPADPSQRERNEFMGPDRIYTIPITKDTFAGIDLSGLNVYLSDDDLPSVTIDAPAISLDNLLPPSGPAVGDSVTRHGKQREQQRLRTGASNLLLLYGSITHDHRGAEICLFDGAAWRRLERDWGPAIARRLDRLRGTYAVAGTDGTVITVGHRYTRVRRDVSRRDRWPSRRVHRRPRPLWALKL